MAKITTKLFSWLTSFLITIIISTHCFGENATILRPESSFAPDNHFFNDAGEKVFLDQFEGKTILLCFWASWCESCVDEIPSLDILQKDFRKLPFEIVAVSEDYNGIEVAKNHFTKYGIRHLKLYHDYKNELFKEMSVVGLPTAFLIDREGKIKIIFKGIIKWHDDKIREMLLAEIDGNYILPKNSYISTSLNKMIVPANTNEQPVKPEPKKEDSPQPPENSNKQEEKNESNQKK